MPDSVQGFSNLADVQALMAEPPDPGHHLFAACSLCGAVAYVRLAGSQAAAGDPVKHVLWHRGNDHCHGPGA